MRKVTALCAFALVAAGAAAVGATTDPPVMRGSDTLFEIFANQTVDNTTTGVFGGLIRNCGTATASLNYTGTGSGNGETDIVAHTERVAPMSRAIGNKGCDPDIATAEGIVFALDGVAISVSGDFGVSCSGQSAGTTGGACQSTETCVAVDADPTHNVCASGAAVCSPSANDCDSTTGGTGLAYSRTITVQDLNHVPGVQCTPHSYNYTDPNAPTATPVSAVVSKVNGCSANTLAGDSTPVTYTIGGAVTGATAGDGNLAADRWKDVLRILLLGMPNGTGNAAAGSNPSVANRDCNSDLRWTLAASYAKIFQTDCTNADGKGGNCSEIKHIFRRDEFSGTTDVFLATLGFQGIDITLRDLDGVDATSAADGTTYRNSRSFFCNVRRNQDTWLFPDDARVKLADGTSQSRAYNPPYRRGEGSATVANEYDTRPYFPEYQDADPIRRACDATNNGTGTASNGFTGAPALVPTEQVCGARGSLGLVLPISQPPSTTANDIRYPVDQCAKGRFVLRVGPVKSNNKCDYCPNGDKCLAGNLCFYPVSASVAQNPAVHRPDSTVCINGQNNLPTVIDSTHGVSALPTGAGKYVPDGRVYNLTMHNGATSQDDSFRVTNRAATETSATQHVGAYFRIHQTRSLLTASDTATCQQNDDTQHIGCLVNASKCSMGYSGREGPATQAGAMDLKVNNLEASESCVRELLNNLAKGDFGDPAKNYPMSRKLFLNTMVGFENHANGTNDLSPGEYALAQCTAGISDGRVQAFGFISLPNDQPNPVLRDPFCQDYDGTSAGVNACAANDTTDACANNTANGTTLIPSNGRPCKLPAGSTGLPCLGTQVCADLNGDGTGDVCQAP